MTKCCIWGRTQAYAHTTKLNPQTPAVSQKGSADDKVEGRLEGSVSEASDLGSGHDLRVPAQGQSAPPSTPTSA